MLIRLIAASLLCCLASSAVAERPNVLFIAIDDLRPELGCYGHPIVQSPNLDRLAADGMRFNRAYCQQAICSPSRASLMTGRLPGDIGVIENTAYFRELNPDIVTLPQHFIAAGYETVYSGKIYHQQMTDDDHSWSRSINAKGLKRTQAIGGYLSLENQQTFKDNLESTIAKYGAEKATRALVHGPAFEAGDVADEDYPDGFDTSAAIQTLGELVKEDKPWFLALGFHKPHLPFIAPKRYFDLYDPAAIELASQIAPPIDGCTLGLHASFELRTRHGIPKIGPVDDELARKLLHAYYACTSYVDAQIGRMLAALDEQGVRDNTIIVVWGDHGWHLGEYGIWGKATNYEIATRVPLIVWTPNMQARGAASDSLVELVDLYPTLCDLAGLDTPKSLAGTSFKPILDDAAVTTRQFARSQFPTPALREWAANPLSPEMRETFFGPLIDAVENRIMNQFAGRWDRDLMENRIMGYATRTDRYRLVRWIDMQAPGSEPLFVELYDHQLDPHETRNVAADHPQVVARLTEMAR